MVTSLQKLPFFVVLVGIGAAAMFLPAIHAAAVDDFVTMRAFFYSASFLLVATVVLGLATANNPATRSGRSHLLALLAAYTVLPAFLALPFYQAVGNTSYTNAYFEMVSSFTTTGATLFAPERLAQSVHLWRAEVGWLGGFFVWVTAVAVLAPLNLGGYEVLNPTASRSRSVSETNAWISETSAHLRRYALRLAPLYIGLTLVLWFGLFVAGGSPLTALCLAMSILSTSGISPTGSLQTAGIGYGGEILMFLFLFLAVSRRTFTTDLAKWRLGRYLRDPEVALALVIVISVPSLLFLRHWFASFEVNEAMSFQQAVSVLWGGMFTVLSFLTTTGFESQSWGVARAWSGLATPGLILVGLALIGGGVATTAGGVKLLRVYALYKHGAREMEKLVHPNSVGGAGSFARRLRRQGAYVAWIFFMLFAVTVALVAMLLSMAGLGFEAATVMTISALSTTGPLAAVASESTISYATLPEAAKAIVLAAMVLGRLETLAIIALLNPDFWRS